MPFRLGEQSQYKYPARGVSSYTGCRVSEARQLKADDLVGDAIVFRKATTKTNRTRSVPLHPQLKAILQATDLPATGYLFPGRSGQAPITVPSWV